VEESANTTAQEMASNPWFKLLTDIGEPHKKEKLQDGCTLEPLAAKKISAISKIPKTELVGHQECASTTCQEATHVSILVGSSQGHIVLTQEKQGYYSLPGGKVEGEESPLSAAYRELWEETGISQDGLQRVNRPLKYLGTLSPHVLDEGQVGHAFSIILPEPGEVTLKNNVPKSHTLLIQDGI
jgi:hypothetical protein